MDASTKNVAIYLPATAEYGYRLPIGARRYCDEHGGFVLRDFRYFSEHQRLDASQGPPPWAAWKPHGVIVYASPIEVDMEWLKAAAPCIVNTTPDCPTHVMPVVHIDVRSIIRLALEHFDELGLRNFAHVGVAGYGASILRRVCMTAELAARNKPLLGVDLVTNPSAGLDYQQDQAAREPALLEFLRAAPKPLAVLAANDSTARVVCSASAALGLKVPQDVAVLGVDNCTVTECFTPTLSSIRTPGDEVGYQAMRLLDRLLRGGTPPREAIVVQAKEVVARQSTCNGAKNRVDIDRALRLIREQACKGIRVGDVADALSISRRHLEAEFLRAVGHTPGQEICRVRLELAELLLRSEDHSITEVAGLLGFERASNFSEFFRNHTGMSPREFRQKGREKS